MVNLGDHFNFSSSNPPSTSTGATMCFTQEQQHLHEQKQLRDDDQYQCRNEDHRALQEVSSPVATESAEPSIVTM